MQIYVFGFYFFSLWAAFDLKTSFLSRMRCWSRDQGLAVGSCWLAPGRTFGPNSVHVLGFCLFKIHLVLSSPWKLPLREIFRCLFSHRWQRRWCRMPAQCLSNTGLQMPPIFGGDQDDPCNSQESDYGSNDFMLVLWGLITSPGSLHLESNFTFTGLWLKLWPPRKG